MDRDKVQIAMAADAGFAMPLGVTLTSLALAHHPGELRVTVLYDRFAGSDRERIERSVDGRIELCWRQVADEELAGVPWTTCLTRATLFRLLLPEFLPDLDRVIYLDADLVVTGSLRALWETDLEGRRVAAVREAGTPFAAGPAGTDWRRLGIAPDQPYFNAGVLVIPLSAWRADNVSARVLEVLRTHAPRWGDQDGLNVVMRGEWKELRRRWNVQSADVDGRGLAWALWREDVEDALGNSVVIHYTDRDKPWNANSGHPLAARWYETLDQSAWAGWRPVPRGRPLYRRVGSRTKRAWRVLTAEPSGA